MKLAIKLIVGGMLCAAILCGAQGTNGITAMNEVAPAPGQTAHSPAWKFKTANDAAVLLSDFGVNITGREILSIIGLLVGISGASRGLRKWLPDSWQANKFGLFLAHAALEVNPTLEKLRAACNSPSGQTVEALVTRLVAEKLAADQKPSAST